MAKEIPLTQGKVAIVDDADYEWLNQWKWYAEQNKGTWYARRCIWEGQRTYCVRMHRVILNAQAGEATDHINGNGLDNRRTNLRICTTAENNRNCHKRKPTSSRFKGVFRWENRWRVQICVKGQNRYVGTYGDEEEAARAYNEAATKFYGEFASLNAV